FRLPPPRDALAAFAAELNAVIRRERIDLLLPTCEEVFFVSRVRNRLPSSCTVFAGPFEQLRELHSKWTFLALARECDVPAPDSACVQDIDAARKWAAGRGVVLKPEFSRFGVHVRLYPHGIPEDAPPLESLGAWIVQAFQAGTEICSYSIAVNGRLRAHMAYRPAWRIARSSSYYFDPVSSPRIRKFVERFVGRQNFTGQISFDWIESPTGELHALECNPRAISGLHLFELDDPLPAAMVGEQDSVIAPAGPTPRMLSPMMLSVGLPVALRQSNLQQWRHDWSRARCALAIPGDKAALFGAIADMEALLRISARRRCNLRTAATRDIEWDGAASLEE
ncbi:MAG TPA: hypothetical protein VFO35_06730, partial [Steroidobacteraceae bacterium]|nr:hypothetical protein [Steroidobacteraceae bacterium]